MLQSLALWNPGFNSAVSTELENGEPFILFNFANIDRNSSPSNRSCIFRGFLFDQVKSNVLVFTTDKRSGKYHDLMNNPNYEACFYFSQLKKQYRFKGVVRMISDDFIPNIKYKPGMHANEEELNADDSASMNEDDDSSESSNIDEQSSLFNQFATIPQFNTHCKITDPLEYKLFSQNFIKNFESSTVSLTDLHHQASYHITDDTQVTPTDQEWKLERERCWKALSRNMRKSFKRPLPGSALTKDKMKLLDSINRGVDGSNNSTGYENFVVVCMFVDLVDQVELSGGGYDKRYLYRRTSNDAWKEYEVCP